MDTGPPRSLQTRYLRGLIADGTDATLIPLSEPSLGRLEAAYVERAIESGWVTSGPFLTEFETHIRGTVDARHAVATSSGTAALHLALLACGIGAGDEVLVPTLTFIAPANAIRYVGAAPVFIDADADTWQMDIGLVNTFLKDGCRREDGRLINATSGRRVGGLMPVHILGHPVDMDPLLALAADYDLPVIEDATESLGAKYKGRPVGALGSAGCLSFNGNKLVTTGGGGMIVTNTDQVAETSRHLSTQAKASPDEYIHDAIGFNYRMSNLAAALGCAQMERIEEFLDAKQRIASAYVSKLAGMKGIDLMPEASWAESAFWLYTIRIGGDFGPDARTVQKALAARSIQTRPVWQPLHLSAPHRGAQSIGGEVAEGIYREALSLPSSVTLSSDQLANVCDVIGSLTA